MPVLAFISGKAPLLILCGEGAWDQREGPIVGSAIKNIDVGEFGQLSSR